MRFKEIGRSKTEFWTGHFYTFEKKIFQKS